MLHLLFCYSILLCFLCIPILLLVLLLMQISSCLLLLLLSRLLVSGFRGMVFLGIRRVCMFLCTGVYHLQRLWCLVGIGIFLLPVLLGFLLVLMCCYSIVCMLRLLLPPLPSLCLFCCTRMLCLRLVPILSLLMLLMMLLLLVLDPQLGLFLGFVMCSFL